MSKHYFAAVSTISLVLPTGLFLHECTHYAAAEFFGWDATLNPGNVTFVGSDVTDLSLLLFHLAGPLNDTIFMICGFIALHRIRRSTRNCPRPMWIYWIATACTLPAVRWIIAPFLGQLPDEAKMSSLLGLHYSVIPWIMFIPGVALAATVVYIHWRCHTVWELAGGFAGGAVAVGLWLNVIGPFLL